METHTTERENNDRPHRLQSNDRGKVGVPYKNVVLLSVVVDSIHKPGASNLKLPVVVVVRERETP